MIDLITAIGISLGSLHIPHADQNQVNPGVILEAGDYRAGIYRNSLRRTTAFVGYSLPLLEGKMGRLGLLGAIGTGYHSPLMGGLEYRVGQHLAGVFVPKFKYTKDDVETESATTIGFVLRFPIK